MKATAAIAAILAAAIVTAAAGGELVVSPHGMSPEEALLAIRAAKANGEAGA